MIDLNFLWTCKYFTKQEMHSEEILFDEGEHDTFLYIIYDGELVVEKKIKAGWNYKTLSYIRTGNILWEGWLIRKQKKEVRIRATRETILLKIAWDIFVDFVREFPSESYQLLIHIIAHGNDRLLKANTEITANYEISRSIAHIKNFDTQNIEKVLETIETILESENILYLEKNTIVPWYYKVKYSCGLGNIYWENAIIYVWWDNFDINALQDSEHISLKKYSGCASVVYGWITKWYLIISRSKKQYNENDNKLLENAATSFAGVVWHKEILDIEKNKKHIKNI